MKKQTPSSVLLLLFVFLTALTTAAQNRAQSTVTGTVIEAATNTPLEYASIYAQNESNSNIVSGAMTDEKGHFSFDVPDGNYYIKIDFLGFKTLELKNISVQGDTFIGVQKVQDDTQMLEEVTVIAERSTVDIKLDKKIYNVGQDMIVKGGTAADVLDNVPSVVVDSEGTISLRGNENVKVLIDGKPTGLANNIQEAMRILPAESIDRVEVITNPSARYEAEGGAGIINIILRKGKALGINGSVTGTIGDPRNYELNTMFNFRSEKFNFFTSLGYRDSKSEGYNLNDNRYIDPTTGEPTQRIYEYKDNNRERQGYNGTFGLEWYLTPSITWTNTVTARRNTGYNPNRVRYDYYDASDSFLYNRYRNEEKDGTRNNVDYTTTFEKKFDKEGHVLTIEGNIAQDKDNENAGIDDINEHLNQTSFERTFNKEKEKSGLAKVDYTLPIGENGNFEAGYLGTFKSTNTAFNLQRLNNNSWNVDSRLSNTLEYKENIHALYAQYGDRITSQLSFMVGLRWEDSSIDVNQIDTESYNNKKYNDFFPSAFLNYEWNESTSTSISYSRRVNRPRGFFLNPFSNYTSDINFFQGNPDLNPAKTHAVDLGFMKRWTGFTLNASAYYNKTDDTFQFVRRIAGETENGTPISISSPINLATEHRYGVDITLNYSPFKWWRLNGNFNFYRTETRGDYTFTHLDGTLETQNFDQDAYAWFTRISSKITLPYKIDWQLNGMYRAPYNTAQGKVLGNLSGNVALSKDILKDKGTITFNISDIFNSRKREQDLVLPQSISHSEMQWRGRQINLSFTYRFNQTKKMDRKNMTGSPEGAGDMEGMEML
ncbi:outer membrane receptor protein involved in Fe transport [Myroides gitamensis]|uniref:TonB-dependent receptor domain-containing protein n=1 Tax=Myroides odoratus TaxID=256 RepID=UPI002167E734|nr:TonB-dependent receptor [Myroides odoratus]MCS4239160.1 outer membrane receptor protein involved in Fe transport [Myroides odoratus]MDH6599538.1 outer membrane receptor protein involved in Fe transport [Myroides gitamensis]